MTCTTSLIGYTLRQVIGDTVGSLADRVERYFVDHSQKMPKALNSANERTWQALRLTLAGDGVLDRMKVFFASGDAKSVREQLRLFLETSGKQLGGLPSEFRQACLSELEKARRAGLLAVPSLSAKELARETATWQRYRDPESLRDGADKVVARMVDGLAAEFTNLRALFTQAAGSGPPLIVSVFAFFFRREVEADPELAHGLFFDGLRQLANSQSQAFTELGNALAAFRGRFDEMFVQLAGIETVVVETRAAVTSTHGAVLDLQAELQGLAGANLAHATEVRHLLKEVLERVSQAGMQSGECKPHHSCSIRSDEERQAVKHLLARFRQLPKDEQSRLPALLNGLGKLQVGAGDFEGATRTFVATAEVLDGSSAEAEVCFNAYRAALEEKKWDQALAFVKKAAVLDARFAPFPLERYEPTSILGAGGFGTAFLCRDRFLSAEVVVKSLHDRTMERSISEVFREAQVLAQLHHPAVIGVKDANYADLAQMRRPYIVMDYFSGGSLGSFIDERGTLPPDDLLIVGRQIAEGMQAAHRANILHRDLKPDNILVHKEGSAWRVKIIDFGLAFRKQTVETSGAAGRGDTTVFGESIAGTMKYAPPEQMGELQGVKPGPYSDVYSFGKVCCYALFKTTEPKNRHWSAVPKELHEMLERCTEHELAHRLSGFEHVLKMLDKLEPVWVAIPEQQTFQPARAKTSVRDGRQIESKLQEQVVKAAAARTRVEVTGRGTAKTRGSQGGPAVRQAPGSKLVAGLCGVFLGALGVHKFILGMTTSGVIMLLVSVLTCGLGAIPMALIGLIEGIIYLTKSDDDFYKTYVVEKKAWF